MSRSPHGYGMIETFQVIWQTYGTYDIDLDLRTEGLED